MSLICDNGTDIAIGDTSCQSDVAINFLKRLFGSDFIGAFYGPGSPATASTAINSGNGDINTIALILNKVAIVSISCACLLIAGSVIYFVIDGANDGVGQGFGAKKDASILGLIGRPFYSLLMMLPTFSGYSVVHILIIFIALTGNAAANKIFGVINEKSLPTVELYKPQTQLSQDLKAVNDVSEPLLQGAMAAYCMRQTKDDFTNSSPLVLMGTSLTLDSNLNPTSFGGPFTQNAFTWVDGTGTSNDTGMSGDICGKFTVSWQAGTTTYDASDLSATMTIGEHRIGVGSGSNFAANVRDISEGLSNINQAINQTRAIAAINAYAKGFAIVNGNCLPPDVIQGLEAMAGGQGHTVTTRRKLVLDPMNSCGFRLSGDGAWPVTKSNDSTTTTTASSTGSTTVQQGQNSYSVSSLITAIKEQNTRVDSYISDILSGQDAATLAKIEAATKAIKDEVQSKGWLFSGISQSRLRQLRDVVRGSIYNRPFEFEPRNITNMDVFQDQDGKKSPQQEWMTKIDNFERAIYNRLSDLGFTSLSPVMTVKAGASGGSANIDVDSIVTMSLKDSVLGVEKKAIQTMLGTESNSTALERIQTTGELFTLNSMVVLKTLKLINKTLGAVVVLTAPLQNIPIVSAAHKVAEFADTNFSQEILPLAIEISNAMSDIGRVFGVIIPTMPFFFLAMAALGWFIQILQTMFGMLPFFIMHAIPQSKFLGSQQQGYVTLLSLFFRPMLIVAGFFVGFVMFEVAVDFIAYTFFAVHATVQGQTLAGGIGFLELVTLVTTMKWWWYVLAGFLVTAAYTCFGLTQEFADGILDWLGVRLFSGFGNMKTDTVMQGASVNAKNAASDARRLSKSEQKQSQTPQDPSSSGNGNPSPNALEASQQNSMDYTSQKAGMGVTPTALTTTSTNTHNDPASGKAASSLNLPSKENMIAAKGANGENLFVNSKYNPKSEMVAKAHANLDGKKKEIQLQGGILGAGVAALGGLVGARHGISNRLDALKASGDSSIASKLSAVTSGGLTGFKQGMGAADVAHYRSISEIGDFHRANEGAYGMTDEQAAISQKSQDDANAMGANNESAAQNLQFTPISGADFVARRHEEDIANAKAATEALENSNPNDNVNGQAVNPTGNNPTITPTGGTGTPTMPTAPTGGNPMMNPTGNNPTFTPPTGGTGAPTMPTAPTGGNPMMNPTGNNPTPTPTGNRPTQMNRSQRPIRFSPFNANNPNGSESLDKMSFKPITPNKKD